MQKESVLKGLIDGVSDVLAHVFSGTASFEESQAEEPRADFISEAVIDISTVVPLLDELKTLLNEYDAEAVEKLDQIKGILRRSAVQDELDGMEQCLGKYDFEGASEILDRIKYKLNV